MGRTLQKGALFRLGKDNPPQFAPQDSPVLIQNLPAKMGYQGLIGGPARGDDPMGDFIRQVREHAESEGADYVVISAQLEADLVDLEPEERPQYLASLGVTETGLGKLIRGAYHTLGLISYFTAGEKEARAWTIPNGAKAPEAAGAIHSDLQRGFIRAEVIAYEDMIKAGSAAAAKEKGWMRLEGKEYVVRDGDVILFRFNV